MSQFNKFNQQETIDMLNKMCEIAYKMENENTGWILTKSQRPRIGTNVEYSECGEMIEGTMDYTDKRVCMMAGIAGGYGYFGEGFATDGENGCDTGLICDDPKYWRYWDEKLVINPSAYTNEADQNQY